MTRPFLMFMVGLLLPVLTFAGSQALAALREERLETAQAEQKPLRFMLGNFIIQLRQLEQEAMAAMVNVKSSEELAAWRKRYITGGE